MRGCRPASLARAGDNRLAEGLGFATPPLWVWLPKGPAPRARGARRDAQGLPTCLKLTVDAYTTARGRVSINVLVATLKKLAYAYPYHQVVDFHQHEVEVGVEPPCRPAGLFGQCLNDCRPIGSVDLAVFGDPPEQAERHDLGGEGGDDELAVNARSDSAIQVTVKVDEAIPFSPDCLNDAAGLGIGWMPPCSSMLRA